MENREKLDSLKKFSGIISQVCNLAEKGMTLEKLIQTINEKYEEEHKNNNELKGILDAKRCELFFAKDIIRKELKKEIKVCDNCMGEGGYCCQETGEGEECDVCNGKGFIISKIEENK